MSDDTSNDMSNDTQEEKHRLDEPRFVDRGDVTAEVFREDTHILEINSKTGLYPLYVAYSVYRMKLEDTTDDDWEPEELQAMWEEVLRDNIYVICKTPMAKYITTRTLTGYHDNVVNAHYFDDLVNMLKSKPEQFKKKILKGSYWGKEVKEMKFDAVVGNPPYQEEVSGVAAQPIYQYFVMQAKALCPQYISMITPSRWMTATNGSLVDYRAEMIKDNHLTTITDFQDATQCFPSVEIKGGISYFLWNGKGKGDCLFNAYDSNGKKTSMKRPLSIEGMNTIIRDGNLISIFDKVQSRGEASFSTIVSANDPFGFDTREDHSSRRIKPQYSLIGKDDSIPLYYNGWRKEGVGFVHRNSIRKGEELISSYKFFIPKAWGIGNVSKDWLNPFIPEANAVCTETYLVVGPFATEKQMENAFEYTQTKSFHVMVSMVKSTQNTMQKSYVYVPLQDFERKWLDVDLYQKYQLTPEEIAYIESKVKEMN